MSTNKAFQVSAIKRLLKQKGIEPDLVDVDAYVDETLTLSENARIIQEDLKFIMNSKKPSMETQNQKKIDRFIQAVDIYEKKTRSQKLMDSRKNAKETFTKSDLTDENFKTWKNQTNRYDIEGVDTKYYR